MSAGTPLALQLGEQIAALRFEALPQAAIEMVRRGFIDTVGVVIGGSAQPAVTRLQAMLPPGGDQARLLFGPARASAPDAALVNGTAAHVLDFDDVSLRCHISAVLVPAILAEAEARDSNGREMIAAYVAGYETMADLVEREEGVHNVGGWHTTGVHGAIAAAAAAARLNHLDPVQTAQALGIAASFSAGVMANFGSMMKPIHAGQAARAGIMAVRMVAAGIDASPDALDHPQGFLRAVSPEGRVDRNRPAHDFAADPRVLRVGLNIKRYPTCYCTHRLIDAVLAFQQANGLPAAAIERIDVMITEDWATILRHSKPRTALEAKFSAQFAVASAMIARSVGLMQLQDAFVQRADVVALMRRVRVLPHRDYDPVLLGAAVSDRAEVVLRDGHQLETPSVARALGHAENPLDVAALRAKFNDCLAFGGQTEAAEPLWAALAGMEDLSARALCAAALQPV